MDLPYIKFSFMKKAIFLLFTVFLSGGLIAQKVIIHDLNAELRTLPAFRSINVSDAINLYISQGDEEGIVVSAADGRSRENIHTSVENGVLKIWGGKSGNRNLKVYVSFKTLEKLAASGASDIFVHGLIKGDQLEIVLSGASDFRGKVELNNLNIEQSGASDAFLSGTTAKLKVQSSGASDLKGFDLMAEHCDARASGASDIRITVTKELSASASGASSVYYKGEAVMRTQSNSGASRILKKS
jgi:hypothetical protein